MSSDNILVRFGKWGDAPTIPQREWYTWDQKKMGARFLKNILISTLIFLPLAVLAIAVGNEFSFIINVIVFPYIAACGAYLLIIYPLFYLIEKRTWKYILPSTQYCQWQDSLERFVIMLMIRAGFDAEESPHHLFGKIGTVKAGGGTVYISKDNVNGSHWHFKFRTEGKVTQETMDRIKSSFSQGIEVIYTEKRFSGLVEKFDWDDEYTPKDPPILIDLPWLKGTWSLEYEASGAWRGKTIYVREEGEREGFFTYRTVFEDLSSTEEPTPFAFYSEEDSYGAFFLIKDKSGDFIVPAKFTNSGLEEIDTPLGKMKCLHLSRGEDVKCKDCDRPHPGNKCELCDGMGTVHNETERWYHLTSGILVKLSGKVGKHILHDELVKVNPPELIS